MLRRRAGDAFALCRLQQGGIEEPALRELTPGHFVSCHCAEQLSPAVMLSRPKCENFSHLRPKKTPAARSARRRV